MSAIRPIKTTVSITPDDYEWLKKHPQYSISGAGSHAVARVDVLNDL